jgi:hypothetical protein
VECSRTGWSGNYRDLRSDDCRAAPRRCTCGGASSSLLPATHLRGGICEVEGNDQSPFGNTPPSASTHPTGAEVVWIPVLNDKACKPVLVRGTARIASALARDIDHAPMIPPHAVYCCPMDGGSGVRMYSTYRHHRAAQRIDASLTGCAWISGPGNGPRSETTEFRRGLEPTCHEDEAATLCGRKRPGPPMRIGLRQIANLT